MNLQLFSQRKVGLKSKISLLKCLLYCTYINLGGDLVVKTPYFQRFCQPTAWAKKKKKKKEISAGVA